MTRIEILAVAKPILFNTEMVRAILEGRKTVTRRAIKDKDIINNWDREADGTPIAYIDQTTGNSYPPTQPCPHQPDAILYVRETWCERMGDQSKRGKYIYKAHAEPQDEIHQWALDLNTWRPSIHMPKEAARLFLRVTGVWVERLQDISPEDVEREGINWVKNPLLRYDLSTMGSEGKRRFAPLWDSTIKPADLPLYGWNANPWVWVIDFERLKEDGDSG